MKHFGAVFLIIVTISFFGVSQACASFNPKSFSSALKTYNKYWVVLHHEFTTGKDRSDTEKGIEKAASDLKKLISAIKTEKEFDAAIEMARDWVRNSGPGPSKRGFAKTGNMALKLISDHEKFLKLHK